MLTTSFITVNPRAMHEHDYIDDIRLSYHYLAWAIRVKRNEAKGAIASRYTSAVDLRLGNELNKADRRG